LLYKLPGYNIVNFERKHAKNFSFPNAVFLCLFAFLCISCANPFIEQAFYLKTITFNTNGGSDVPQQKLLMGETVKRPGDPVKESYLFNGWYIDNGTFEKEWDFHAAPDTDLTLYTRWTKIIVSELAGIELKKDPKLVYTHGELLDLSNLEINLLYNDGSVEAVPFNEFALRGIITMPENGIALSRSLHNGVQIEINYKGFNASTAPLVIGKVVIANVTFPSASAVTFGQELYDSYLTGGDTSIGSFAWLNNNIQPEVNNSGFEVVFTPFNIDDYDFSGITGWNSAANTLTRNVLITVNPAPIAYSPVTVIGPMKGQIPDAAASGDGHFTASNVTWTTENPQWTQGSEYLPLTVYTASVTLTANANYTFNNASAASINGNEALITANTGNTITISYTFAPTDLKGIQSMTIESPPALEYIHGDTLNLYALSMRLVYDDGTDEIVEYNNFAGKNIGTNYSHGMLLSRSDYHGHTLTVSIGNISLEAGALVVNPRQISIESISHTKEYDTTTSIEIDAHSIELEGVLPADVGYVHIGTINAAYTSAAAGTKTINITNITLAGNAGENYFIATSVNSFTVNGGITKAGGAAVTVPAAEFDPQEPKITITTASTLLTATGQDIEYAIYNGATLSAYGSSTTFENLSAGIYRVYARSKENANYNAGTPSVSQPVYINPLTFAISVEDITNGNTQLNINSGIVLSRSSAGGLPKTAQITVNNANASYVEWYYDNEVIHAGSSIALSVSNNPQETTAYTAPYNIVGKHLITVVVTIGGVDYSRRIEFEVRQ
jgi:uncharacterized repeat protein (TIGR02543 family)